MRTETQRYQSTSLANAGFGVLVLYQVRLGRSQDTFSRGRWREGVCELPENGLYAIAELN